MPGRANPALRERASPRKVRAATARTRPAERRKPLPGDRLKWKAN